MFDLIAVLELLDQAANESMRTLRRGVYGHKPERFFALLRHDR
jgi:hypothetical protein